MFLKIGYNNVLNEARIIAAVGAEAAPVKRMIQEAKDRGTLIDATAGKKTKTVFVMDSDHIVLSAWALEDIQEKQEKKKKSEEESKCEN